MDQRIIFERQTSKNAIIHNTTVFSKDEEKLRKRGFPSRSLVFVLSNHGNAFFPLNINIKWIILIYQRTERRRHIKHACTQGDTKQKKKEKEKEKEKEKAMKKQ